MKTGGMIVGEVMRHLCQLPACQIGQTSAPDKPSLGGLDPGLARALRDALANKPVTGPKIFGGLALLSHGHMVCGACKGGVMGRVGRIAMPRH